MCRIGISLHNKLHLDEALENLKKALHISLRIFGQDHFVTARIYKVTGSVMNDIGERDPMSEDFCKNMQSAQECFEKTIRILESLYGPEHPEVKHTRDLATSNLFMAVTMRK